MSGLFGRHDDVDFIIFIELINDLPRHYGRTEGPGGQDDCLAALRRECVVVFEIDEIGRQHVNGACGSNAM